MSTPAIKTERLTKQFGDVTAVSDLDLTVETGEVFGFLGPNGAGKSTTIDVLLDLVRPTAGRVRVLGCDPRRESRAIRSRIGVLPEGYGLYDRLSAREHVEFARELREDDADPESILDRVGLVDDADRPVGGFSKGMRQRLALGMALVGRPDLLILDEPSSGLDPNGIREMREIVREEADRGATVFFSSHLMEQVEAVCDRVGIMRDGELVVVDTIDGLRRATGAETTLVLSVDEVPDSIDVVDLEGVADVTVSDSTLRIACSDPGVKTEVIARVESTGVGVTDIDVEETNLADLFAEYAAGDSPAEAA